MLGCFVQIRLLNLDLLAVFETVDPEQLVKTPPHCLHDIKSQKSSNETTRHSTSTWLAAVHDLRTGLKEHLNRTHVDGNSVACSHRRPYQHETAH